MKEAGVILLCYLLGSIPFSYIFTRIFAKQDIRTKGSGNVGATNVFRITGARVAIIALVGDLCKGLLAAWLAYTIGGTQLLILLGPIAAIVGHIYPVFLKFKGGKGVATAAGILLYLMPAVVGILLVVFIIIVGLTRYVSLASMMAAALLPVLVVVMGKPWNYILLSLLMAILVIYHHRVNIERLRNGTESKISYRTK